MADEVRTTTGSPQPLGDGRAESLAFVHDQHGSVLEWAARPGGCIVALPRRDVEPVGNIARLGRGAVGGANRRPDPVALALERIGRQADPPAPLGSVETLPVDGHAELPHAAE